jgi:hypothetical protein
MSVEFKKRLTGTFTSPNRHFANPRDAASSLNPDPWTCTRVPPTTEASGGTRFVTTGFSMYSKEVGERTNSCKSMDTYTLVAPGGWLGVRHLIKPLVTRNALLRYSSLSPNLQKRSGESGNCDPTTSISVPPETVPRIGDIVLILGDSRKVKSMPLSDHNSGVLDTSTDTVPVTDWGVMHRISF